MLLDGVPRRGSSSTPICVNAWQYWPATIRRADTRTPWRAGRVTTSAAAAHVLRRRREEREALLDRARSFVPELGTRSDVLSVVVFGSVARGDFHEVSDIDVLVIAADLPTRPLERLAALGVPPSRVELIAWTPEEWQRARRRGDPVALECLRAGVWLYGTAAGLDPHPD